MTILNEYIERRVYEQAVYLEEALIKLWQQSGQNWNLKHSSVINIWWLSYFYISSPLYVHS